MSSPYKRWYDHDKTLLQVIELLKNYQEELAIHAEAFLALIEERVSAETIDSFYEKVKPINGCRWYDKNPVISKTVELLRVIPPDLQKTAAQNFIKALEEQGITLNMLADN